MKSILLGAAHAVVDRIRNAIVGWNFWFGCGLNQIRLGVVCLWLSLALPTTSQQFETQPKAPTPLITNEVRDQTTFRAGPAASNAPADSRLNVKPVSSYQKYRGWIWLGGIALVSLATAVAVLAISIVRRRRAEKALRELNALLHSIFDAIPDLVTVHNRDLRVVFSNWRGHTAVPEPMRQGNPHCYECYQHREQPCDPCPVQDVFRTNRAVALEMSNPHTHRTLEVNAYPVLDTSGKALLVTEHVRDITDRKRMEERLREDQKTKALGQLAGGIAHDFNNILAAIIMNAGLMRQHPKLEPELAESIKELEVEANRAARLTRQLLMYTRQQVMQIRPIDLNKVLDELLSMLQRLLGETIKLEFQAKPDLPLVQADASMMEQVVMTLAVNARDAMPKGGRLILRTGTVEIDTQQAQSNLQARPGLFACMTITDTGCGMDEDTLAKVFEPFFTTKDLGKGKGLGLATVYGIVKQHQGWPEVESAPGTGTTIRIYLPLATGTAPKTIDNPVNRLMRQDGGTILVVEDEPGVRRMAVRCLQRQGYRVLEASDANHALNIWKTHHQEIDLLLTDMVMPEGMTGLELAEHLQSEKPSLKAIISSGYSLEISSNQASLGDKITYLDKPYQLTTLIQTVRQLLTPD
jgi:signal transduction histidine kinase/CheY-like chemotaxis protein